MIHIEELAEAVNRMRIAQRDYFRKTMPSKLFAAKALERRVDEMLNEYFGVRQLEFTEPTTTNENQNSSA